MCTKSQLEAIEEEMVNYYRSVYGDSIDTITKIQKKRSLPLSEKPNTSRRICIRPWNLYM